MSRTLTRTRLATLILIAALGALPVIAALPVRAGDLGQTATAAGQILPASDRVSR